MDCDHAIERLPWLLNDTLEGAERRQVLDHVRDCAPCRAALADTRTAFLIFDWHPAPADLVALAAADATPLAAAAPPGVAEHVEECARCAADLELVRASRRLVEASPEDAARLAFLAPAAGRAPAAGSATTGSDTAGRTGTPAAAPRAWKARALAAAVVGVVALSGWLASAFHTKTLEQRLALLEPAAAAAHSTAPALPRQAAAPQAAAPAPAATDTLAALRRQAADAQTRLDALTADNRRLAAREAEHEATLDALSARAARSGAGEPPIRSNVAVVELAPDDQASRGSAAAPSALPLSKGAATVLLHTHGRAGGGYEMEVRDAQDRPVGGAVPVAPALDRPEGYDELDLTLPRGTLAPGAYTLHLFRRGEHGREAVATYSIRVS